MRPGPAPTPTSILTARGSKRGKARSGQEPTAPRVVSHCAPSHLDDEAKRIWESMVVVTSAMKLLTAADLNLLSTYCAAASRHAEAERHLKAEGAVVLSPTKYPIVNPWLAISNKAAEQMMKVGAEFGLSPSSRTRLHLPAQQPAPDPEGKDRFFRRLNAAGILAIAGNPEWEAYQAEEEKRSYFEKRA